MHFNINKGGDFILRAIGVERSETPLRWEADVISRVPEERLIVSYTLYRGATKVQRLIGKFYAGGIGQSAYQAMTALQQALASKARTFILAAPAPHFYDAELDLIVQEFVVGVPYYDLIEEEERVPFYFIEAGKALAALHSLNIRQGARRSISNHLEELIHPHPLLFADIMPDYHATVEGLIQEMIRIETQWKIEETIPIHRDFHLRQLFHDEKQIWLIDWDLLAMGDPALDVGNFMVYLETRLGGEKHPELIDTFLEGYFSEAPSHRGDRIYLYKSLTYLRLACKAFRLKPDGWEARLKKMLLSSERCLLEKPVMSKK